jgi:hypothetical protein
VHAYEWGGYNKSGTVNQFKTKRPKWAAPIHQLLVDNKVTALFLGQDHVFGRERMDGVVYQSVPNPADNTYTAFFASSYDREKISLPGAKYNPDYGVVLSNSGYLHVTVSPASVGVDYVRAVLPADVGKQGANARGALSYTIEPR